MRPKWTVELSKRKLLFSTLRNSLQLNCFPSHTHTHETRTALPPPPPLHRPSAETFSTGQRRERQQHRRGSDLRHHLRCDTARYEDLYAHDRRECATDCKRELTRGSREEGSFTRRSPLWRREWSKLSQSADEGEGGTLWTHSPRGRS